MAPVTSLAEYEDLLQRGPRLFGAAAIPLLALVAANMLPLVGVLLLGWDLRGILLLYWAENVIVAIWAIVRMLVVGHVLAIPLIAFFCFHFGIFMMVHLVFVYALTEATDWEAGQWHGGGSFSAPAKPGAGFFPSRAFLAHVSWWALAALFVSHGISFGRNFLASGEWRKSSLGLEMGRPYPRMIVMHIAIIAGAFAIALLGEPAALLVVLVLLKILVDSAAHVIEHRTLQKRTPSPRSKNQARPDPPEEAGGTRDD